jgi:hypothetical protein
MARWQEIQAQIEHDEIVGQMKRVIRDTHIVLQEASCLREEVLLTQCRILKLWHYVTWIEAMLASVRGLDVSACPLDFSKLGGN